MSDDLVLVVADRSLGDRADLVRSSLEHIGMVGREYCGRGADHRAERVVELLSLGLLHSGLEGGTGGGFGAAQAGDLGVLIEVVVVVGGCANNRALFSLARSPTA